MTGKRFHVTDAELAVLQVLWDRGTATTRDVCNELNPDGGGTSEYYTIQKLLERLEKRDCVTRDRTQRVHLFSPAIDRETLIEQRLRDVSDSLCDGAVIPMLSGLIRMRQWTADEQEQLKKLLHGVSDAQDPKQ